MSDSHARNHGDFILVAIAESDNVFVSVACLESTLGGNVIMNATNAGIQFQFLFPAARNILVANNTLFSCYQSVRVWENGPARGDSIRFTNNLSLSPREFDWIIYDSDNPGDGNPRGPGDGAGTTNTWTFDHNWRETLIPPGDNPWSVGWLPPSGDDVREDAIEGLSRDPAVANFLRPEAAVPLATAGSGATEPTLPKYIGAVPPEGAPVWPWSPHQVVPAPTTEAPNSSKR